MISSFVLKSAHVILQLQDLVKSQNRAKRDAGLALARWQLNTNTVSTSCDASVLPVFFLASFVAPWWAKCHSAAIARENL